MVKDMKKAVFKIGGKQYFVTEGQVLEVELITDENQKKDKKIQIQPLILINEATTLIGKPLLDDHRITAEILEPDILSDKVMAIRYKAKKRVHKIHGHRQHHSQIKIIEIA
jgi:large subunit ribosomal protein L21